MGSSSSFSSNNGPSPEELRQKIQNAKSDENIKKFERELQNFIEKLLTQFNDRSTEEINQHLKSIKDALAKEIDGTVDLLYGGSIDKHTYIDGLSDVDSLVLLNDTGLEKLTPKEVKDYFAKRLSEKFPQSTIVKGQLAVTINFQNHEIQLLPAVKTTHGYLFSKLDGTGWSSIKPQKFAKQLTDINKECGNNLVPTIKLVKGIISNLPETKRMTGYHTESVATEIFKNYYGPFQTRDMIRHFFKTAPEIIRTPIPDKTGQSRFVDGYLGASGSLKRKIVSDALGRVSRKINGSDDAHSLKGWKDLFGE